MVFACRRAYVAAAAGILRIVVVRLSANAVTENAESLRSCGASSLAMLDRAAAASLSCLLDKLAPADRARSWGRRALADLAEDALSSIADALDPCGCSIAARISWPAAAERQLPTTVPVLAKLSLFSPAVPPRARAAALRLMRRCTLALVHQTAPRLTQRAGIGEINLAGFKYASNVLKSLFSNSVSSAMEALAQLAAGGRRRGAADADADSAVGWWAVAVAACEGAIDLPANPFKMTVSIANESCDVLGFARVASFLGMHEPAQNVICANNLATKPSGLYCVFDHLCSRSPFQ